MERTCQDEPDAQLTIWVCLADTARARLLRCMANPSGSHAVQQCSRIENVWAARNGFHSSPRRGWVQGSADAQRVPAESSRRFAREVVYWLHQLIHSEGISRLVLIAPPHFLGVLRGRRPALLAEHIEERCGDLTHLTPAELSRHPVLRGFFDHPTMAARA